MRVLLWLSVCFLFLCTTNLCAASDGYHRFPGMPRGDTLAPVPKTLRPISDPRFFGTYCGDASFTRCARVKVKVMGVTIYTKRVCRTKNIKDIKLKLNYTDTVKGALVYGDGKGTLDGNDLNFVISGVVVKHGKVRGTATVAGLDPYAGLATLSDDGLAITIYAYGEKMTLRKDTCGNRPPQVTITSFPTIPMQRGKTYFFTGEVTDAEDLPTPASTFPPERLAWTPDNAWWQLQKYPSGLTAWTNTLTPGNHTITFSATDSGGLTSEASVQVTVSNKLPRIPVITLPQAGFTTGAGCAINFLGRALDLEDGEITGSKLVWSSNIDGIIGRGKVVNHSLDKPGNHTIRLTATDSFGASAFAETTVNVLPSNGGCSPLARIHTPPYETLNIVSGEKTTFIGVAEDSEDLPDALQLQWELTPINPAGPSKVLGTTTLVEETTELVSVNGDITQYRVRFTATDSDGNTGQDEVTVTAYPAHH